MGPTPDAVGFPVWFCGLGDSVWPAVGGDGNHRHRPVAELFNLGAWGALYAIGPEIYPTAMRGTGTGAAAAVGRVAGVVAPLIVPIILEWGSTPLVFTIFGASFFIAVAGAVALPERHNMDTVE